MAPSKPDRYNGFSANCLIGGFAAKLMIGDSERDNVNAQPTVDKLKLTTELLGCPSLW